MALRCRKNQSSLTAAEKSGFVNAVIALKASGGYDTFVEQHMNAMSDAHRGTAFLPWHREYINRFELALRGIDSGVTLPYWNWTVDNSPTSSIWDAGFMGGNGRPSDGVVTTGPFANSTGNWPLAFDGPALRRRFGLGVSSLPTPADVATAMDETDYDVAPWNRFSASGFRNRLEGWINGPQLHNRVHVWVGGSMEPMSSPNDPVFFLHHCFVDKLWADWQRAFPGAPYPAAGPAVGHRLNDPMSPFSTPGTPVRPADTLDHHAMGYAYDNEGVCRGIKLKFFDDPKPTLDKPVLDNPPTLKFRDDLTKPTLDKPVLDNPTSLKFNDDPFKLKFVDDGFKLPAADLFDPSDRFDPVVNPASVAPFVLSTPHHSMVWAGASSQTQQLELAIDELSTALVEARQADARGGLSPAQKAQMQNFERQLQMMEFEWNRLKG